jgi:hypothetical protein
MNPADKFIEELLADWVFGVLDASPSTTKKLSKLLLPISIQNAAFDVHWITRFHRGLRFVTAWTCALRRLRGSARRTDIGAAGRQSQEQASMRHLALPARRSPFHAVSRAGVCG